MYCPMCGKFNEDSASFCMYCGAMTSTNATEVSSGRLKSSLGKTPNATDRDYNNSQNGTIASTNDNESKKYLGESNPPACALSRNSKPKLLWGLPIVALIAFTVGTMLPRDKVSETHNRGWETTTTQVATDSCEQVSKRETSYENCSTSPTSSDTAFADEIVDGDYLGKLLSWDNRTMTVELLCFEGLHPDSQNYLLTPISEYLTVDISRASIWLEWPWTGERDIQCDSIDSALAYKVFGGTSTLRDSCTMQISFTVKGHEVTKIMFLYAA